MEIPCIWAIIVRQLRSVILTLVTTPRPTISDPPMPRDLGRLDAWSPNHMLGQARGCQGKSPSNLGMAVAACDAMACVPKKALTVEASVNPFLFSWERCLEGSQKREGFWKVDCQKLRCSQVWSEVQPPLEKRSPARVAKKYCSHCLICLV